MTLTDLSLELITQPDRKEFLDRELKKINHQLPAAVYIPFVNESARNYAILHIVADEAKIFQTKERAPVLLHFEAFRPEELMLEVGTSDRTKSMGMEDIKKKSQANRDLMQKKKTSNGASGSNVLDLERYDNYRS